MKNIYTHTLENGLRVIHRQFPSEISYCGVAINTGTRDEYSHEWGMAHFVEHMLFKGTKSVRLIIYPIEWRMWVATLMRYYKRRDFYLLYFPQRVFPPCSRAAR